MFYCVSSIPFAIMVGCVRFKVSVHPHVYDDVEMHVIFKGGVFDFI